MWKKNTDANPLCERVTWSPTITVNTLTVREPHEIKIMFDLESQKETAGEKLQKVTKKTKPKWKKKVKIKTEGEEETNTMSMTLPLHASEPVLETTLVPLCS